MYSPKEPIIFPQHALDILNISDWIKHDLSNKNMILLIDTGYIFRYIRVISHHIVIMVEFIMIIFRIMRLINYWVDTTMLMIKSL